MMMYIVYRHDEGDDDDAWMMNIYCPSMTKGSNSQITQIWESNFFLLDLAYSTSIPFLNCWLDTQNLKVPGKK